MTHRVMKQFDKAAKLAREVMLSDGFDEAGTDQILADSRARFEALIPRVPDPGKEGAHLKMFTIASAAELAFWLEMKARGHTPQQTYRIAEQVSRGLLERIPALLRRVMSAAFFSGIMLDRVRHGARVSQERPLGGWQFEFIEGNGDFDFGVNYTRCAIQDFAREIGAEEFGPYICLGDIEASELFGWGLQRTQTIGQGCASCDFRFCKGAPTNIAIPDGLLDV